jgi:hypothetical protein
MKTLTAAEKNEQVLNDVVFKFTRETKQELSITAWEEDNEEYTSWILKSDSYDNRTVHAVKIPELSGNKKYSKDSRVAGPA